MRPFLKAILLFLILPLGGLFGQSVGLNDDGSTPHESAILDIKSNDKGVLIPRLNATQIGNLVNPADGLIVYDQTNSQFIYYNGSEWKNVGGSSPLEVENNTLRLIDGINSTDLLYGRDEIPTNGQIVSDNFLMFDNSKSALRFGRLASSRDWSPDSIGHYSFASGFNAKAKGDGAVAIGVYTEALGDFSFATGDRTVTPSGYEVAMGRNNTIYTPNSTTWNDDDRLFVLGNGTSLVRKDAFSVMKNGNTTIYGTLTLSDDVDEITFPNTDGSNNQILKTDGSGNISWSDDAVNDIDADITNELQTLSISGNDLSISSGNNVSLTGIGGKWNVSGQDLYYSTGSVGVGTSATPTEKLFVLQTGSEDAVNITNSSGGSSSKRGLVIDISSGGSAEKHGLIAELDAGSSTNTTGISSYITAGSSGNHRAIYGSVTGAGTALEGIAINTTGTALKTQGPSHLVGNVAIGSDEELGALHVHDPNSTLAEVFITPENSGSGGNSSIFLAEDDDATFGMSIKYDGTTGANNLEIYGHTAIGGSPVTYGPHLVMARDNGNVAIGADFANGYKLSVDGKVACEEVLVELSGSWPDYVFEKDYKLKSIDELEQYIKTEKHLPGIAPAKEIETEGLQIGEMQKVLTEKIEELTLYIIELNKSNKKLQTRIDALENSK